MTTKNTDAPNDKKEPKKQVKTIVPVVSSIGVNGEMIELVFDPRTERAQLAIWNGQKAQVIDSYTPDSRTRMVPLASAAALVEHNVTHFASGPMEYGETSDLVDAIRSYIHRYVDVSEAFERLAVSYVLLTWVYDRFNELPYLRRRGDYGTGKTRFLTVVGEICYKAIFAGGASTSSPVFHLIDLIGGTLVIDEADFRFSDESALIAKILNAGNVKGYPVLRSESVNGKEFRPRAFKVFGPKIVGMRGRYDDPALESRFLTETSSNPSQRKDMPINLPIEQKAEAAILRDKLLMYRFKNFSRLGAPERIDATKFDIEPRMHQILAPLLSVADDETDKASILAHASAAQAALTDARGQTVEAEVLTVIKRLMTTEGSAGVAMQDIAAMHGKAYLDGTSRPLAARAMGHIIRTKLNLKSRKSHGVFVVPKTQHNELDRLYTRYGVSDEDVAHLSELLGETLRVEFGDVGGHLRTPQRRDTASH
tara:strand:- start:17658 stop:19100 length:1443 start_codon:yes stop_codon:yes gene_type:complete